MPKTTSNSIIISIASLLKAKNISNVVLSPGSRNAPLIMALSRDSFFQKKVVIDERAAAFMALGMAQQLRTPVVLVCTSGSALLNYAPAVAEAYYQGVPLIVLSADRPKEWIDQDDSQTINQDGILHNIVKRSYDIQPDSGSWYVNRVVNEAVLIAEKGFAGPVHINVRIAEPLYEECEQIPYAERSIMRIEPEAIVSQESLDELSRQVAVCRKVMIVCGFASPDARLSRAIDYLASLPNVAVLTETISNIASERTIKAIDRTILAIGDDDLAPDLLITFGGALVSRYLKRYLRSNRAKAHWHIGRRDTVIDTMQSLTLQIDSSPTLFFEALASRLANAEIIESCYANLAHDINCRGLARHRSYLCNIGWCDMQAYEYVFEYISQKQLLLLLHLSNGTSVRYAQLFAECLSMPNYCNRGVSGIDGSTSTAIGASLCHGGITLLITGDMSFVYDLGGLASQYKNPKLKIIVICNGGGGIFRFIAGEAVKNELKDYFEVNYDYRIAQLAEAFGYSLFQVSDFDGLKTSLPVFFDTPEPAIMTIYTPREKNGTILSNYFKI